MARKDDILSSFLSHPMLSEKYDLAADKIPNTVREGLQSDIPIVRTISLIVDNLEASQPITDTALRNLVTQYLNEAAI